MIRTWTPLPGDVVSASRGFYSHVGVVSDAADGWSPTVISASKHVGFVVEEPWEDFAAGSPVRLHGYPGRLPRDLVVARARAEIGRPFSLLGNNCEHLVRRAHGLAPRSDQLRVAGFFAVLLGLVFAGR